MIEYAMMVYNIGLRARAEETLPDEHSKDLTVAPGETVQTVTKGMPSFQGGKGLN